MNNYVPLCSFVKQPLVPYGLYAVLKTNSEKKKNTTQASRVIHSLITSIFVNK